MPRATEARQKDALDMLATGAQVSDVARMFKVSRRTIQRWRSAVGPEPVQSLAAVGNWSDLKLEALDELRRQSAVGKTAATKELHRLASLSESAAAVCANHWNEDEVIRACHHVDQVWRAMMVDRLAQRLANHFDLPFHEVLALLQDQGQRAVDWLNGVGKVPGELSSTGARQ